MDMLRDIESVLISEEEYMERVGQIAALIRKDYADKKLLIVTVLKGGFVFAADLYRKMGIPAEIDFIAISSYGNASRTSGVVKIIKDLDRDITGKHVLIVEDIIDSGLTLNYLAGMLESRGPASLAICALLDKPSRRQSEVACKYVGFVVDDEFLVGCGLDYGERYRNLPFIGILKREIYE